MLFINLLVKNDLFGDIPFVRYIPFSNDDSVFTVEFTIIAPCTPYSAGDLLSNLNVF